MAVKSIKLSGPALGLAKEIAAKWDSTKAECAEVETRAVGEINERQQACQSFIKPRMEKLMDALGVPQDERNRMVLDHRFLAQHGDAFIVDTEQGSAPRPAPAVEIVTLAAPPKDKMN